MHKDSKELNPIRVTAVTAGDNDKVFARNALIGITILLLAAWFITG